MSANSSMKTGTTRLDKARRRYPNLGERFEELIDSLAAAFIKPNEVVVDGGANVGRHTRSFARHVRPGGHVHAFEPIPCIAQRNAQVLRGMKLENLVTMHAAALWNEEGEATFSYFPNRPGRSSLRAGKVDDVPLEIKVPLVTLDSCLGSAAVTFMKLDVEGAEFHALRGGRSLIARSRPLIVFENGLAGSAKMFGYTKEEFLGFFRSLDFTVLDAFGEELTSDRFHIDHCGWYFLAAPKDEMTSNRILNLLDGFWSF